MDTMHEVNATTRDEYGLKAGGVLAALEKFNTLFALRLGQLFFSSAEEGSTTLQTKDLSVQEAVGSVETLNRYYRRQRKEEAFDSFYMLTETAARELNIGEPTLPRYRRQPRRLDDGSEPHRPDGPKDFYRQVYFQACDLLTGELTERFDQEFLKPLKSLIHSVSTVTNVRSAQAKRHKGKGLWCSKKPPKTEDRDNECTHHQRKHVALAKEHRFGKGADGSRNHSLLISMDDKAYLRPGTSGQCERAIEEWRDEKETLAGGQIATGSEVVDMVTTIIDKVEEVSAALSESTGNTLWQHYYCDVTETCCNFLSSLRLPQPCPQLIELTDAGPVDKAAGNIVVEVMFINMIEDTPAAMETVMRLFSSLRRTGHKPTPC
ncbi:Hypp6235 [Branchiostoma lanceolatum]|uniref:Hypp6235 protein n=1 Tax=Branchiostoma lanceolatum TaxID=7740 RepID=A0A8J9VJ57_BRALA|nr:Hypp6235 [Branchiostoma lanceolatum]